MECELSAAWEISLYDNDRELIPKDVDDGTLFISIVENQLLLRVGTFPIIFQKQDEWETAGFLMSQSFSFAKENVITVLTVNNPKCDKTLVSAGTPRSIIVARTSIQAGALSVLDCPCK